MACIVLGVAHFRNPLARYHKIQSAGQLHDGPCPGRGWSRVSHHKLDSPRSDTQHLSPGLRARSPDTCVSTPGRSHQIPRPESSPSLHVLRRPLSEIYGRTWVLHISNLVFVAFSVACAVAPNTAALTVFRFLGMQWNEVLCMHRRFSPLTFSFPSPLPFASLACSWIGRLGTVIHWRGIHHRPLPGRR